MTTQFEGVKIAMTQDKNGHVLRLSIHPNDTPESIMRDPVGTRYMVVLVRTNDAGEPVPSPVDEDGKKAVALAGTLCGDVKFQSWLARKGHTDDASEEAASVWLRKYLAITSRKELKTDSKARKALYDLRSEFVDDLRTGGLYR
jgi:hypothetical protein